MRIAVGGRVSANQSDQVRHPHAGGEPFAADVAEREHQTAIGLLNREEITRQVTDGEDLAGDVERSVTNERRRTQTPVYLCCFEDRGVQFSVIFLQGLEFLLEFAGLISRGDRMRSLIV